MVLAFNNKAAAEIGGRIRERFAVADFANARTFHGLAWQIVRPHEEPIYDDPCQKKVL